MIRTEDTKCICEDFRGKIEERGSTDSKSIKYSAGVIDSSYRGEWFLVVTNCNNKPLVFTNETNEVSLEELKKDYVVYPQRKAIFQAVVHNVNVLPTKIEEVTYKDLQKN